MPIRLLLVDDSATFRELAKAQLTEGDEFEVIGEATDGVRAVELTVALRPDLVLMDVEMPTMDGFEATREIMDRAPTPVVIVSARSDRAVRSSLEALEAGALTATTKPPGLDHPEGAQAWRQLARTLRAMAAVRVVRRHRRDSLVGRPPERPPDPIRPAVIAMAASTGGPAAYREILAALPAAFAIPILLVQHIGPDFVDGLARWLDATVPLEVRVARDAEDLRGGRVYVAPAAAHLAVRPGGRVRLFDGTPIGGFLPSATALYESVADEYRSAALAVILTGMGRDGLEGLRRVRERGGQVVAQDEATCVVASMPGEAVRAGLAHGVLPLSDIGGYLLRCAA